MSTVFEAFNGMNRPNVPQSQNADMFTRLRQFANTLNGNPEQIVRNMLQTGQMSQQQFNQLSQAATQFQNMMGGRF